MPSAPSEYCPNCGHELITHRQDRQSAGDRQINLHWLLCAYCRHVALKEWSFIEPLPDDSSTVRETVQRNTSARTRSKT